MKNLSALIAGVLFGAGLVVAGMTDPLKVLAFLTLDQNWDATLLVVMMSAATVTFVGFRLAGRRAAPLFESQFNPPTSTAIDGRLLGGAALFGAGWGLAGFCPGPALVGLMTFDLRAVIFVAAYAAGVLIYEYWQRAALASAAPVG